MRFPLHYLGLAATLAWAADGIIAAGAGLGSTIAIVMFFSVWCGLFCFPWVHFVFGRSLRSFGAKANRAFVLTFGVFPIPLIVAFQGPLWILDFFHAFWGNLRVTFFIYIFCVFGIPIATLIGWIYFIVRGRFLDLATPHDGGRASRTSIGVFLSFYALTVGAILALIYWALAHSVYP